MKYNITEFNNEVLIYEHKLYNYIGTTQDGEYKCILPNTKVPYYFPMKDCQTYTRDKLFFVYRHSCINKDEIINVIFEENSEENIESIDTKSKLKSKVLEYSLYRGDQDFMLGDNTIRIKLMGESDDQYISLCCFDDTVESGERSMDFTFEEIYKISDIVKKLELQ